MTPIFPELLRSNFRCGRMPHSRTDLAGRSAAPMVHP